MSMYIDIAIIFGLLLFIFAITLYQGKRFVLSILLGIYISIPIVKYLFIDTGYLVQNTIPFAFILMTIVSSVAVRRYLKNSKGDGNRSKISALILSTATVVLLLTAYFYYVPETLWTFSANIRNIFFASPHILGILYSIPLIALLTSAKGD